MAIQELELGNAPFILELLNTPQYIQFIGDKNVHSIKDAEINIQERIDSYVTNGFGLWLATLKESGVPIGTCGLIKRDTLEHVDIGFAFHPNHFNKGYAYEAAKACLRYGYEKLGLSKVVGITDGDNQSSIKLLEKLGLQFEKEIEMPNSDKVQLFSVIKKPD
ncbi:hypothetical protein MNBD_BACTEROID06-1850 [hydrothermal vent metagenome]|uniref:N-acetyltransferase domain-containing protein n=1 Tax=hydrothermal vent metagenome TaxID=652676 RepID=A0A3B0UEK2_9ZZZZ